MRHRHLLITIQAAAILLAAFFSHAAAQTSQPRVTLSAIAGQEQVAIDGGQGSFAVGGASIRLRVLSFMSLHGEVTTATGEVVDSYQGVFTSIAGPGASREEIERLGVVLRRDRVWTPGTGLGFGVVFHTPAAHRAGVSVSLGLAGREIALDDLKTLISLPEGWPQSRSTGAGGERYPSSRGGPFLSLAVPINVTNRLVVSPEIRWLGTVGDEDYTVTTLSVQAGWRF